MDILVLGAGLAGLSSAYALRQRGHRVTVIERRAGPGLDTSFANGSLLTPSMSDPWNAPGSWRTLLASLARPDSPLQLRLRALPWMLGWGLDFLRFSSPRAYRRSTLANLRLGLHSLTELARIEASAAITFDHRRRGTLRLFRTPAGLEAALRHAERLAPEGLSMQRLDMPGVLALEPALGPIADQLVGGLLNRNDETGDAHRYCQGLADRLVADGVTIHYDQTVTQLVRDGDRIRELRCGGQPFHADRYVLAAGSDSGPLAALAGLRLPLQPVKGYSYTVPDPQASLATPIVDDALHAVIVPMAGQLRIAGTAEFTGFDRSLPPRRIANLFSLLATILPQGAFDHGQGMPWCGLRAMTSDGVPLIGETPIANLLLNTGHGHLGWTLAAGSADLLGHILQGAPAPIDPCPYALARF